MVGPKKTFVQKGGLPFCTTIQYYKYFSFLCVTAVANAKQKLQRQLMSNVKALGARLTTNAGRDAKIRYPSSAFPTQSRLQPSAARTFVEALHRCKVLSTVDQGTSESDCARWLIHLTQNGCPRVTMCPSPRCLPQRDSCEQEHLKFANDNVNLTHIKSNHDYKL